jgi:pimeloyl-ACP methyl ester carboxylesterase
MMQPRYEYGGSGSLIHIAIANGFPPQVYTPLVKPLAKSYRIVCLPPRALWPGEQPPNNLEDWHKLADDLLNGLREYDLRDVIAIGHSFGGIASLLAVLAEPTRFRALCLLDPTILLPVYMQGMAAMQAEGSVNQFPLVQGALRRRRRFDSVEAAYAYFKGKSLFQDWPDETLKLYVEGGTQPAADSQGVELVWSPEWEAYYFSTLYTKTWDVVTKLKGLLPLLVIRGANSDTFIDEAAKRLHGLLPDMTYAEIPGHGHLFPQSAPDETRQIIERWLGTLA